MPLKPLKIHRRNKSHTTEDAPTPPSPRIYVTDAPTPPSILRSTPSGTPSDTPTSPSGPVSILNLNLNGSVGESSSRSVDSESVSLRTPRSRSMFSRSDTTDSRWSDDTPGTSTSSLSQHCPLPESTPGNNFPFFAMTLSSTSTLQFIALPVQYRPIVLDAIQRAWKRGIKSSGQVDYAPELMQWHKRKGCDGGVWEVSMKETCWNPKSEDKVSSKRIILRLMTEFARLGYSVTSSYRTSAKDSGKDTLVFLRGEPDPDPVFFGVAFYGSDRIWLIDADADVGTTLESGIKAMWVDGVRDARVRERHCREIRLKGSPWVSHNSQALISARIIHIVIRRLATLAGYHFECSVNMGDADEAEIPLSVYRLNHGSEQHPLPHFEPVSDAAARSMSVGQ